MRTRLELHQHLEVPGIDLDRLHSVAEKALPLCVEKQFGPDSPLGQLQEIEISLIDDAEIGRVHGEFLDDPTPTDVITFDHGEILVSLETAERQARQHGCDFFEEVARYVVHGLLHLAGYEDASTVDRSRMVAVQEAVLASSLY